MGRMRKVIQLKTYYVCRCCKQPRAVIVALHRRAKRQTWSHDKGNYEVHEYDAYASKLLFCLKCGTLDLRARGKNWYIRKAYKIYPYYRNEYHGQVISLIRSSVNQYNNIKEARQLDEEKATREGSSGNEDQESVPSEVREPPRLVI